MGSSLDYKTLNSKVESQETLFGQKWALDIRRILTNLVKTTPKRSHQ
jgi:hypothetical protein